MGVNTQERCTNILDDKSCPVGNQFNRGMMFSHNDFNHISSIIDGKYQDLHIMNWFSKHRKASIFLFIILLLFSAPFITKIEMPAVESTMQFISNESPQSKIADCFEKGKSDPCNNHIDEWKKQENSWFWRQ